MNADREGWYALFVVTGDEEKVKERINYRFEKRIRAIVPKRKIKERREGKWEYKIKTLFPGYVLINGNMGQQIYETIRGIPGVIRVLRDSSGPQELHEAEIELICRLTGEGEIIPVSQVYTIGKKVFVVDGPLLGMEGLIKSIDKRKGRAKVVLNLLGEPREIELSITMVQPA